MSAPEIGKRVEVRRLKPGQTVPCDGRIYWDETGQAWFGLQHPLEMKKHYRRLLAQIAKLERRKVK